MWIVLDSTELRRAQADLDDADLQTLFAAHRSLNVGLAVPEVVLREMLNAIGEEATARAARADREIEGYASWTHARIEKLGGRVEADVAAARARFEKGLRERGVRILPLPKVPHDLLVARDLARRKPFDAGRGYRDALIWESVLALAEAEPVPIVLVTANAKDFGGDALHAHLMEDVAARGWAASRIVLSRSTKACLDEFVRPRTRPLPELSGASLDEILGAEARERLENALARQVRGRPRAASPLLARLNERGYEVTLEEPFEGPTLGPVQSATEFPDGTRLVVCQGAFRSIADLAHVRSWHADGWITREMQGTLSVRIVLPPGGGTPHALADEFRVISEHDLSEEARAHIKREIQREDELNRMIAEHEEQRASLKRHAAGDNPHE
jgi:hypothetical protein